MGNGILEADEEETRPSHHCGPHDHLLKSRYLERDSRPGLTWNDLKSPGTWPPHVINTYKIHDGYVQSNIKIQKTVAYTMWLFPFPDMQIFSFCRPKYPKKNILFQTLCAAFGGQTVAVCLLTTTSDVWQFSCGFLRFPVIFPWTNCKWPFLDHLANGEKEWPFVVGQ